MRNKTFVFQLDQPLIQMPYKRRIFRFNQQQSNAKRYTIDCDSICKYQAD